jgi:hypothetical protein
MVTVYFERTIRQNTNLMADDFWMLLYYNQFKMGKITIFEYIFALHNGSTYIISRALYLLEMVVGQHGMILFQRATMFGVAFYILILLQKIFSNLELNRGLSLLLCSILGMSHTYFQLLGSIIGYLGQLICVAIFLKVLLMFFLNKRVMSQKTVLFLFLLLSMTNSASLIICLSIMLFSALIWISAYHHPNDKEKDRKLDNVRRISIGVMVYWILFISQNIISSHVGRNLAGRNDLEEYNSTAQVGSSSFSIALVNLRKFISNETPVSPYSAEYGHGGSDLFINSITVNLLNWLIPNHVIDDLQEPFAWVNLVSLFTYFGVLLIIFRLASDRVGMLLMSFMALVVVVSIVPLYLMRGDSFAWYNVRYQLLLPFVSMICVARALALISKIKLIAQILSILLFYLLISTGANLISSGRF